MCPVSRAVLPNRNTMWAMHTILNFLVTTFKKVKRNRLHWFQWLFYFTKYIQNTIISTCSNIKNEFTFFSYQAFEMQHVILYLQNTFQMLKSHIWLVTALLESTHLEKCLVHRKWSVGTDWMSQLKPESRPSVKPLLHTPLRICWCIG